MFFWRNHATLEKTRHSDHSLCNLAIENEYPICVRNIEGHIATQHTVPSNSGPGFDWYGSYHSTFFNQYLPHIPYYVLSAVFRQFQRKYGHWNFPLFHYSQLFLARVAKALTKLFFPSVSQNFIYFPFHFSFSKNIQGILCHRSFQEI